MWRHFWATVCEFSRRIWIDPLCNWCIYLRMTLLFRSTFTWPLRTPWRSFCKIEFSNQHLIFIKVFRQSSLPLQSNWTSYGLFVSPAPPDVAISSPELLAESSTFVEFVSSFPETTSDVALLETKVIRNQTNSSDFLPLVGNSRSRLDMSSGAWDLTHSRFKTARFSRSSRILARMLARLINSACFCETMSCKDKYKN